MGASTVFRFCDKHAPSAKGSFEQVPLKLAERCYIPRSQQGLAVSTIHMVCVMVSVTRLVDKEVLNVYIFMKEKKKIRKVKRPPNEGFMERYERHPHWDSGSKRKVPPRP